MKLRRVKEGVVRVGRQLTYDHWSKRLHVKRLLKELGLRRDPKGLTKYSGKELAKMYELLAELKTKGVNLLELWKRGRNIDDSAAEQSIHEFIKQKRFIEELERLKKEGFKKEYANFHVVKSYRNTDPYDFLEM